MLIRLSFKCTSNIKFYEDLFDFQSSSIKSIRFTVAEDSYICKVCKIT